MSGSVRTREMQTASLAASRRTVAQFYEALQRVQRQLGGCREVDDLFATACEAAVAEVGVAGAWVGLLGGDGLRAVARCRIDDAHADVLAAIASAVALGPALEEGAARTGLPCVSAVVPFRRGGQLAGVLGLHDPDDRLAADGAVPLLNATVSALSLALDGLDRAAEQACVRAEMAEREETYRVLFESARDALLLVDEHGFWDCNEEAERLFGASRRDLLGRTPADLSPHVQPDGRSSVQRLLTAIHHALAGTPGQLEWRFLALDGRSFDAEITLNRVAVANHPLCLAVVHDLTERKDAERKVERELARYRTLLRAAQEGIHIVDGAGRLVEANPRFFEMLGYDPGAAPPLRVHDWDPSWTTADTRDRLRTTTVFETVHRRADGSTLPVEVSAVGVALDGQPLLFCSARDLTERRREEAERAALQRQLLQAQKLESVGRLAGGIAHDFNNVLTVVTGYADLLALEATEHPDLAKMAQAILQAAGRATQLTRQLLTFSRRHPEEAQVIELDEFVQGEVRLLSRLLGDDVDLLVATSAPGARLEVDPGYLSQVLLNLAANARDAMPRGGRLELGTSVHKIDGQPVIRLTVRDTGDGMPPEVLDRLFEPFFTTKGVGEGTGLGLATVYTIVRQLGGAIDVSSNVGRGTTVVITLPALASPVRRSGVYLGHPANSETILVVEDEPEVLSFVQLHLVSLGYHVLTAPHPWRALELAHGSEDIDLVVTDVLMPDMSGTQLAGRLQTLRPDLPVLFVSGFTSGLGQFADGIAPDTFLAKPFTASQLSTRIRRMLDDRPSPASAALADDAA